METSVTYTSDRAFLSTDERWLITRIGRLAEKHPDSVNIIRQPQENDGCLYCEIPSKWVKITPPKTIELTDEQRAERAERMRNNIVSNRMRQTTAIPNFDLTETFGIAEQAIDKFPDHR